MLYFWLVAAALSLGAAALILRASAGRAVVSQEADPSMALYRRQMSELDELVERGVMGADERRTAEAEAGRRLLAAAERDKTQPAALNSRRGPILALALLTPALALGVYLIVGAPGVRDQPMEARVAAWRGVNPSSLQPAQMAAVLEGLVKERPGDAEALRFLAQAQLASDQPFDAESNLRKALAIAPERADLWSLLGQSILSQGDGSLVGADAAEAFQEALKRDPSSQASRYFVGRALIESGKSAEGVVHWKQLLASLPQGAPGHDGLAADIAVVEKTGKLPPPTPVAAEAPEMQGAIQGMVDGLAARLAENPDDPEGWMRLVRAYHVLGDEAKSDAALAKARDLFKDRPEVLKALDQAKDAPQ